ncbi:MAG TPA: sodium:solute symporter [Candidatus Competibacteraceae bacterium]|nr:MAG: sodium:solute symporter family protein [Candidatus Competibacteraceae bacterium]HOB62280.1 sodium:solute symporter [Candidatus Competibacteraceae bacterium]HQA27154.1 sodium:solute symporter [Candidatus Competibacteraceae bacterium]HQD56359.1 sodium:solute symporter [Candidatus Competibacteraceae bacterium]
MTETAAITPKVAWIFGAMILYWAYCILWGIIGARRARTASDYFLAGRQLSPLLFTLAATATCFSGWTFIGHPGLSYTDGWQYAYASFYALTIPLTGILFLKRQWLLGQRHGFVTPGSLLAAYFRSDALRVLVVMVALLFSVPYVGLQLRAAGFLFNVLTDGLLGVEFGMWVLASVVVSYVASGGLRTVAWVDVLQAPLLAVGIVAIGLLTLHLVGGWDRFIAGVIALAQDDPLRTPDGYSHYLAIPGPVQWLRDGSQAVGGPWTGAMILSYLIALMGIQASPAFSMLAFASRKPAFAAQQFWASAVVMGLILMVFTVIQGIGGHFLGADRAFLAAHPDLVHPVLADELKQRDLLSLPGGRDLLTPELINWLGATAPWLMGLLALAALAAMESTASCYMATAGGLIAYDLVKRFLLPSADDHTLKFIGRIGVMLVVMLALLVAEASTDALALLGGLAVSYGLQMTPALVAVCYWSFPTRQGIIAGLLVGLAAVTLTEAAGLRWFGITAWGRWPLTIHAAVWGLAANWAVTLLTSAFTRDDAAHKADWHRWLAERTALPAHKRRWVLPIATLTGLWMLFAIGPGAVIGNTWFGTPDAPTSWLFGIPPIWTWQLLGWAVGAGLLALLTYYLELGCAPRPNPQDSRFPHPERTAPP